MPVLRWWPGTAAGSGPSSSASTPLAPRNACRQGVLEQFRLVDGKLQRTATVLLTAGPVPAAVMAWTERVYVCPTTSRVMVKDRAAAATAVV
jgi:hypothetical protein